MQRALLLGPQRPPASAIVVLEVGSEGGACPGSLPAVDAATQGASGDRHHGGGGEGCQVAMCRVHSADAFGLDCLCHARALLLGPQRPPATATVMLKAGGEGGVSLEACQQHRQQ